MRTAVGVIVPVFFAISSIFAAKEKVYVIESGGQKLSKELTGKLQESFVIQLGKDPKPLADADWQHLIVLSSNIPYEKKQLVDWIEQGGNVLWALEPNVAIDTKTKSIAKSFGRVLDDKPSLVHDYFSNKDGDSTWIKCQSKQPSIVPGKFVKGVGHRLDKTNPLVFPILIASATASKSGSATGKDNIMVSGLTARNGARILVAGSVDCVNEELVNWTFNRSHSLRVDSFTPKILSKEVDFFRIRDNIEVEVCLSQRQGDAWGSFLPDDAQIELVMMDPKIRANLHPNEKECLSTGPVQLPSRYGVYSLSFRYQRHGYTHLIHKETLTVYPYLYDQSPRWTPDLFPYYGAWISQMTASLLVLLPMLLHGRLSSKQASSCSKKI